MTKYCIDYTFYGRSEETIDTDEPIEKLRAKIEKKINGNDTDWLDPTSIDNIDFTVREMHPVTRGERQIWTTYVRDDDVMGHA
ncbi:hypothetical protein [Mesorhizobium sp. M8A.F.Ca.ET.021.01.1.1]|uniref:hypothetical protein n=1 Tax=Mesorhizobium sp. M8A.F.Ca.ET.021.01.1.1 TaxID=2496757 RepID=UPI000FCA0306|nr:hypothetical protein [Mesorhizobium sp. M8A.F.Ca.ET.021.01.1.1]RUW56378.1 hypothetical protein EOA36_04525 [Mesorhizobium sp. M8A.F.Ca.ET.021.01.1.1]